MSRGRPTEPCRSGKEEDRGEAGRYPHAQYDDAIEPQIELGHGGTTEQQIEARPVGLRINRAGQAPQGKRKSRKPLGGEIWIAAAGGSLLLEGARVL